MNLDTNVDLNELSNVYPNHEVWLNYLDQHDQSSRCTFRTIPGTTNVKSESEVLFWAPNAPSSSIAKLQTLFVASSRLGRALDEHGDWFDAIRTIGVQLGESNLNSTAILTTPGTTSHSFVVRVAQLFQIPLTVLKPFPKHPKNLPDTNECLDQSLYFLQLDSAVQRDQLCIQIASEVICLEAKPRGITYKAIESRLNQPAAGLTKIRVTPSNRKSVQPLIAQGGIPWWLYDSTKNEPTHSGRFVPYSQHPIASIKAHDVPLLKLDEIESDQFLYHWTRRRNGPWPDQSENQFLDDLIFQTTDCQHSNVAALCRILATQKIFATNQLSRGDTSVCSFTNVPLNQFPGRRKFRSHLGRWDFELLGIAINRTTMTELGCQPVIYGDESTWGNLPVSDRPFFQVKQSSDGQTDWTQEKEWRCVGDVALNKISRNDAFIFVPNDEVASRVASLSRFPIVILSAD